MTSRISLRYGLSCITAILTLAGTLAAGAQAGSPRFPLTAAVIVAALQDAGLSVAAQQVQVPMPLSAASQTPALRLTAAELLPNGQVRVRLACKTAGDCLPFLATVDLPDPASRLSSLLLLRSSSSPVAPIGQMETTALRIGAHTTLLMETAHMRIALPVITLDAGHVGNAVRVSSLDRKQTFRGVVEPSGMVRGDIP